MQCLNQMLLCPILHSHLAPLHALEDQLDGHQQEPTSDLLTIPGTSKTPTLLQMPFPSLTRPRHPEGWHHSLPSSLVAESAIFGGCLDKVPNSQTQGTDTTTSREGPYFWLCTKDSTECEETGGSVHSGVRGHKSHKSPVLLSKQRKKAPRRPEVRWRSGAVGYTEVR